MFSRHIIPPSKLVRDCIKSGGDPKDLTLWGDIKNDAGKGGQKGQEFTHQHLNFLHIFSLLILVFLFDCLRSLSFVMFLDEYCLNAYSLSCRDRGLVSEVMPQLVVSDSNTLTELNKDIDALRKGRADGVDCKEITLQSLGGPAVKGPSSVLHFTPTAQFFYTTWQFLIIPLEIAAVMGSDVTPNGIRFQFTDRIKPTAKIQQDIRSAGLDPKDIDLDSIYSIKKGGKPGRSQTQFLPYVFLPYVFSYCIFTNTVPRNEHKIDSFTQISASTLAKIAQRVESNSSSALSSKTRSVKRLVPILVAIPKP
ncbi:hypothetical protein WAI453_002534 [Rhynchosporium graminicola]